MYVFIYFSPSCKTIQKISQVENESDENDLSLSVFLAYTTNVPNILSAHSALKKKKYFSNFFTAYPRQKKCLILPFIKQLDLNNLIRIYVITVSNCGHCISAQDVLKLQNQLRQTLPLSFSILLCFFAQHFYHNCENPVLQRYTFMERNIVLSN